MYCSFCHTQLSDDFAFCTNCGKETDGSIVNEQETILRSEISQKIRSSVPQNDESITVQSHAQTSNDVRNLFEMELDKRGIEFVEQTTGRRTFIQARSSNGRRNFVIRVKTKRNKGNWHSDTKEAEASFNLPSPESETEFWAFVNLNDYKAESTFWIVPISWMRNDIWNAHQKYLDKRGGKRAQNDDSTHHSIDEKRLTEWKERWDLLGFKGN